MLPAVIYRILLEFLCVLFLLFSHCFFLLCSFYLLYHFFVHFSVSGIYSSTTATFGRAQEEIARRKAKRKVKQVGTKTEQGKYCGKYALTELLLCGECGMPYRRCTWTAAGRRKSCGGASADWITERNIATTHRLSKKVSFMKQSWKQS